MQVRCSGPQPGQVGVMFFQPISEGNCVLFVVLAPRQFGALEAARCRGGLEVVSPGGGGASSVAVAASRGSQERTGSVVVLGDLDQASFRHAAAIPPPLRSRAALCKCRPLPEETPLRLGRSGDVPSSSRRRSAWCPRSTVQLSARVGEQHARFRGMYRR